MAPKDLDAFVKFEFHYPSTVSVCVCPESSVSQSVTFIIGLACKDFREEVQALF